jgi:chaperonin GroES
MSLGPVPAEVYLDDPEALLNDAPAEAVIADEPDQVMKLLMLARSEGDISGYWLPEALSKLGSQVVEDYTRDDGERSEWKRIVEKAQKSAAQEAKGQKDYPWNRASNVQYPLLTVAATQFNARAYPAIVKGDEAIAVKVVGADRGRPQMVQTSQGVIPMPVIGPDGQPVVEPDGQPQIQWVVAPGAKATRAGRVRDYLNTVLFYRMEDWEADTDALLLQLPIDGCAFRKVWYDADKQQQRAALVSALRIVVPSGARSCETTPRLTEEVPDVYPHQINERMRSGFYREVELQPEGEQTESPRLLLEQHRLIDVDGDGLAEPYIVTVDHATAKVLRVEANFAASDVSVDETGRALSIARGKFYIKYSFFPHPQGKFYDIGLGHLLEQIGDIVNTAFNQMIDAGHAQVAGGGFIASGIRLQGNGRTSALRFAPGEYKTVNGVTGDQLRNGIYERTFPGPSQVMVSILDMMLSAARDISSVKDVITGDASNNGQVGTTLALIEQGLQVFTAIYKRIYRSLREEYALLFENISKFGGERAARDYAEVLDDEAADFTADFNAEDMDIRPVSDPSSVTRMQKMARAQFVWGIAQNNPLVDQEEALRRVFEAADVEDFDKLITKPPAPDPQQQAMALAGAQGEIEKTASETARNNAGAVKQQADALKIAFETGMMSGAANDPLAGGFPGMAGGPGDALGYGGDGLIRRSAA